MQALVVQSIWLQETTPLQGPFTTCTAADGHDCTQPVVRDVSCFCKVMESSLFGYVLPGVPYPQTGNHQAYNRCVSSLPGGFWALVQ